VPRYQRQVVSNAPNAPRLTANPSESAFGGGAANDRLTGAIQGFGEEVSQVMDEERKKANQARLLEKRRALNDWEHSNIYSNKSGAINRTGKNALGTFTDLQGGYDSFIEEQMKDLANDEQKLAFRQMAQSRREKVLGWADSHEAKQMKVFEAQEFEAGLESSKERGSVDTANIGIETTFLRQSIMERGESEGWSPEVIKQELQKHESDLHARSINRMVTEGNDLDAQAYFKEIKKDLDPDVATKISKVLEEGSLLGEGQRRADAIMGKGLSMAEAYDEASKIKDPKMRKEVESQIGVRFARSEKAERDAMESLSLQATNIIEQTGSFEKIPADMVAQMKVGTRSALKNYARRKAEGLDISTDWVTYYDLVTQATTPELQDKFLSADLIEYRDKLSNGEFKQMIDTQAKLRKGDRSSVKEFATNMQIANNALREIGVNPSAKAGTTEAEEVARFRRLIRDRVNEFQDSTGRQATNEEVQKISDALTMEAIEPGGDWFGLADETKRIFQFAPGEEIRFTIDSIPMSEREEIAKALRKRNLQITEEAMIQLYTQVQKGKFSAR
jgi:hypothetical protein